MKFSTTNYPTFIPFVNKHIEVVFQQDNAQPHIARTCRDGLQKTGLIVFFLASLYFRFKTNRTGVEDIRPRLKTFSAPSKHW